MVSYRMYALAATQGLKSQFEGQSAHMLVEKVDSYVRGILAKEKAFYEEQLATEKTLPEEVTLIAKAQQEENATRDKVLTESDGPTVYSLLFPRDARLWYVFFEEFGAEPEKANRWKDIRCKEALEFIAAWKRGKKLSASEKAREGTLLKVSKVLIQHFPQGI